MSQLKIDQSFVLNVLSDRNDATIARAIVALGQGLGMTVMAEGIETEAQRKFFADVGCSAYQGHLFGQAMPLEEFKSFLETHCAGHLAVASAGPTGDATS